MRTFHSQYHGESQTALRNKEYDVLIAVLQSWTPRMMEFIDGHMIAKDMSARRWVRRFYLVAGMVCDWRLLDSSRNPPRLEAVKVCFRRCRGLV